MLIFTKWAGFVTIGTENREAKYENPEFFILNPQESKWNNLISQFMVILSKLSVVCNYSNQQH